ncbi:RHS repeat-associated core domain-containing protein [Coraliomargarita sp. SDUM461004]|uniref:RHS repeat-associated core domain-containing protein n=1 Tax=Thalassobacterium sedimentorum TaxID=3041258 RepID=A0ABU1APY6_9BACT|nr:RHS repeat-associated core domain-containing protein [Coraliomargarita sp. SDUM461004]MDQ8195653.1 RHS repeat-associated core domain-containing protein [Coraliomargarita sp. SDUM461004]
MVGVSTEEDIDYTFDGDNLGVRIKAQIQSGNTPWQVDNPATTGLDAFFRIAEESSDSGLRGVMIGGTTTGPAEYSLLVDGEPTGSFRPDPEYGSGNWSYPLQLTSGESHTVEARAKHLHPDSNHEVSSSSTFTINPQTDEVYTQYDSSGRTLSRSWAWDSGAYQVVQTFQWDASGQLKEITQTDSRAQPELPDLVWTAVYDGLGRRVRTTTDYSGNSLIGPVTVDCSYDPQVEFLEVAISVDGKKTWKVYGADLDANYGSFQGVGGLKVLIEDDTGEVTPLLHDSYGHVLGYMDSQNTIVTGDDAYVWNQLQMSGYGPHSGYQQPTVEADVAYRDALGWQGRRSDPTGFYGMGARLYDSRSGRFLSPDPLGHTASMDLYSYAGGDPLNFLDPSGRGAIRGNPATSVNPLGPIRYDDLVAAQDRLNLMRDLEIASGLANFVNESSPFRRFGSFRWETSVDQQLSQVNSAIRYLERGVAGLNFGYWGAELVSDESYDRASVQDFDLANSSDLGHLESGNMLLGARNSAGLEAALMPFEVLTVAKILKPVRGTSVAGNLSVDATTQLRLTAAAGDRRLLSGAASHGGSLPTIQPGQRWLRGSQGNAARVPNQIAERLAGREFSNFNQLREAFWREVAADPVLSQQFSSANLARMQRGRAPFAITEQQVGGRAVYELDHLQEIQNAGNVYDLDNIIIRTPLNHIKGK